MNTSTRPGFEEFFAACCKRFSKAMQEMTDDPRAKVMPRDAMVTAIVMACSRTSALAITGSEINMEDVEFLGAQLVEMAKSMRQTAADKGIIRRRQ
jgi:hypothetical protein